MRVVAGGCVENHGSGSPAGSHHLLPERDAARGSPAAGGEFHADDVGLAFVVAGEFQRQHVAAEAEGIGVAAAADELAEQHGAERGRLRFRDAFARVRAGHARSRAHHRRDLVVGQLEPVDETGRKRSFRPACRRR